MTLVCIIDGEPFSAPEGDERLRCEACYRQWLAEPVYDSTASLAACPLPDLHQQAKAEPAGTITAELAELPREGERAASCILGETVPKSQGTPAVAPEGSGVAYRLPDQHGTPAAGCLSPAATSDSPVLAAEAKPASVPTLCPCGHGRDFHGFALDLVPTAHFCTYPDCVCKEWTDTLFDAPHRRGPKGPRPRCPACGSTGKREGRTRTYICPAHGAWNAEAQP